MQAYQAVLTISHFIGVACLLLDDGITEVVLDVYIVVFYVLLIVFGVFLREPPSFMMHQTELQISYAA